MDKYAERMLDFFLTYRNEYVLFNFEHSTKPHQRHGDVISGTTSDSYAQTRGHMLLNVLLYDGKVGTNGVKPKFIFAKDAHGEEVVIPFDYYFFSVYQRGKSVDLHQVLLTHIYGDDGMAKLPKASIHAICDGYRDIKANRHNTVWWRVDEKEKFPLLRLQKCQYDPAANAIRGKPDLDKLIQSCKPAW